MSYSNSGSKPRFAKKRRKGGLFNPKAKIDRSQIQVRDWKWEAQQHRTKNIRKAAKRRMAAKGRNRAV